jgi:hypothetical protein
VAADPDPPPVAIVRFPDEATRPVFVRFEGVEIEVAICTRETYEAKLDLTPTIWSVQGVYVLSGLPLDETHDAQARAGTTQTRPLLERVDDHLKASWWRQVILIRRLTRQFDNAETGYLESMLHRSVQDAHRIERTADTQMSRFAGPSNADARLDLETRVFGAIKVGLRLGGLRLETEVELAEVSTLPKRRRADEQIRG